MGRWALWTTAKRNPIGGNYALKSNFLSVFARSRPSRFRPSATLPLYPTFRWFRNAWYWWAFGV